MRRNHAQHATYISIPLICDPQHFLKLALRYDKQRRDKHFSTASVHKWHVIVCRGETQKCREATRFQCESKRIKILFKLKYRLVAQIFICPRRGIWDEQIELCNKWQTLTALPSLLLCNSIEIMRSRFVDCRLKNSLISRPKQFVSMRSDNDLVSMCGRRRSHEVREHST